MTLPVIPPLHDDVVAALTAVSVALNESLAAIDDFDDEFVSDATAVSECTE